MKAAKVFGTALLIILAFVAGGGTAVIRDWGGRSVSVKVLNTLDQPIRSATVRYTTCGNKAEIALGDLAPGKSRSVRFYICGEGSTQLEATLANGASVRGEEMYVESGSSVSFGIESNGIVSSQRMHAL